LGLDSSQGTRRIFTLGEEMIREGEWGSNINIIRRGEATVERAGTGSRAIVARLGVDDVCGEIGFLEQCKATAAVVVWEEEVEVDEISAHEMRKILEAFPGLASHFYHSLALVMAGRLKTTSREGCEMGLCDRRE
jgi:CRP-like cAMP-binding protein